MPAGERLDRISQREASFSQCVRARVVVQRKTAQQSRALKFTQSRRENVGRHAELALQIAVSLWPVEQALNDEQCPPRAHVIESRGEVSRA